jgi:hypothetical protein
VDFLSNVLRPLGVLIQLLLLAFLLRGFFRRYFMIFLYGVVELCSAGANEYVIRTIGQRTPTYRQIYWIGEVTVDLILLLTVIVLTYQAMEGSPARTKVGRVLGGIAAGIIVLPFILYHSEPFSTAWYNSAIQLFNFGAAIMNLALWTALIGRKNRDPQLLTVTAGLGVAVAGAAVAWGMRTFGTGKTLGLERELANLFIQLAYVIQVSIWAWAFRPQRNPAPRLATPSAG